MKQLALIALIAISTPAQADQMICVVGDERKKVVYISSATNETDPSLCTQFAERHVVFGTKFYRWYIERPQWSDDHADGGIKAFRDHWRSMINSGWTVHFTD